MLRVKDIVKLKVFEKNKVPMEIKLEIKLGIATYIQTSVRRTARILSELHPVSKTSVGRVKKV